MTTISHFYLTSSAPQSSKRSKYGAVKTEYRAANGVTRKYDSKREAAYAAELDLRQKAGEVVWWLAQIPFLLPGGVRLVVDFMVEEWVESQGQRTRCVRFCDVKGWDRKTGAFRETPASKNKRKQVLDLYGIDVRLVK